jgi:hypothetical protein
MNSITINKSPAINTNSTILTNRRPSSAKNRVEEIQKNFFSSGYFQKNSMRPTNNMRVGSAHGKDSNDPHKKTSRLSCFSYGEYIYPDRRANSARSYKKDSSDFFYKNNNTTSTSLNQSLKSSINSDSCDKDLYYLSSSGNTLCSDSEAINENVQSINNSEHGVYMDMNRYIKENHFTPFLPSDDNPHFSSLPALQDNATSLTMLDQAAYDSTIKPNNSKHTKTSAKGSTADYEKFSFQGTSELKQNHIIINTFNSSRKVEVFSQYLFGKFSKGVQLLEKDFNTKAFANDNYSMNLTQYGSFDPDILQQAAANSAFKKNFFCIQHLNKESLFEYTIIPSMLNIESRIFIYPNLSNEPLCPLVLDIGSKQVNNRIVLGRMKADRNKSETSVIPCIIIDTMDQKIYIIDSKNKETEINFSNKTYGFKQIKKIKKNLFINRFDSFGFNWLRNLNHSIGKENDLLINYGYSMGNFFSKNNKYDFDFVGISILLEKKSITFSCAEWLKNGISNSQTTILKGTKDLECDLPSFEFNNQKEGVSVCLNLKERTLKINTPVQNKNITENLGKKGIIIVKQTTCHDSSLPNTN